MTIDKKIAQLEAYKYAIEAINDRISYLESYLADLNEKESDPNNPQYEKYRNKWIAETQLEIDAFKSVIAPIEYLATH